MRPNSFTQEEAKRQLAQGLQRRSKSRLENGKRRLMPNLGMGKSPKGL
jgi:hypothetical protein